ncbi:HEAT repeat domain-containing protein [bacterium]|nr:HEAT repeat domain-containing protein [bacterium]
MKKIVLNLFILFVMTGCSSSSDEHCITNLGNANPEVQKTAIFNIVDGELTQAVPKLIILAKDFTESKEIRLLSIKALGDLKEESAVETLVNLLEEKDREVLETTVVSLGKIKSPKAVPCLSKILTSSSIASQKGSVNKNKNMPVKTDEVDYHSNENIILSSIWALGNIGAQEALPVLKNLLPNLNKYIEYNVRQSLKNIGNNT